MQQETIFVYGTLKRNYSNNNRLASIGSFIKEVKTDNKFDLRMDLFPCLLDNPINRIKGELWTLPKRRLRIIDHFKNHPKLYKRKKISIERKDVWAYFFQGGHVWSKSMTEYKE